MLRAAPILSHSSAPSLHLGLSTNLHLRRAFTTSMQATQGTAAQGATALEKHVAFFDRDHDGVIWPADTFWGCRQLGYSVPRSAALAFAIHAGNSRVTLPPSRLLPIDPRLPIYIKRLHLAKHGSDTDSFDRGGDWVQERFEDIFVKYDKGGKGGLTREELDDMMKGFAEKGDSFGMTAAKLEWNTSFEIAAKEGEGGILVLHKDDIKAIMEGSYFDKYVAQGPSATHKDRGAGPPS